MGWVFRRLIVLGLWGLRLLPLYSLILLLLLLLELHNLSLLLGYQFLLLLSLHLILLSCQPLDIGLDIGKTRIHSEIIKVSITKFGN